MPSKTQNYGVDSMLNAIKKAVKTEIQSSIEQELKEYAEQIRVAKPIVIERAGEQKEVTGLKHKNLESLIKLANAKQNVMLVGMAGTGKTKGASQVAQALDLPFYCISVGSQTSKSDLLGFIDASGKYNRTAFRDAFENGGVFVMDEIDAGNSNVLIVLNSALANDVCAFPDGMIARHKDFVFIATANTYGNGADRSYVGRNQIDGATLDRFTVLDWGIDDALEESLVGDTPESKVWLEAVRRLRYKINDNGIRAIISPRASMKGATQLQLGFSFDEVVESVIMPQIPFDRKKQIKEFFDNIKDDLEHMLHQLEEDAEQKSEAEKQEKMLELPF